MGRRSQDLRKTDLSLDADGSVLVWNREDGALVGTLQSESSAPCNCVSWSGRDGGMIASGSDDPKIRM